MKNNTTGSPAQGQNKTAIIGKKDTVYKEYLKIVKRGTTLAKKKTLTVSEIVELKSILITAKKFDKELDKRMVLDSEIKALTVQVNSYRKLNSKFPLTTPQVKRLNKRLDKIETYVKTGEVLKALKEQKEYLNVKIKYLQINTPLKKAA